jgi:small-conductance mechanosensitive channel
MFQQNANASTRIIENAWTVKDVTWQSINNILNSFIERLPYFAAGLMVLFVFWLIAKIVKGVFLSASRRTNLDKRLRILFSRIIVVFIFVVGIFAGLTVIIPTFQFGDLITGLGFTSFVVGFATKDILNNLLSGVLILWQQPFKIGDYIFIGSNQGQVEYIGVRATNLRKDDGEVILIPNGEMYSSALTIRGAGTERRMLLKINVGYKTDIAEAKRIIADVLHRSEGVVAEPKSNAVVTDLTAEGVNLSVYFWINTDKSAPMLVFDEVATGIKKALFESGTEIFAPSPTTPQTPGKEDSATETPQENKKKEDKEWI